MFLIHGVWAGRDSPIWGVWTAPAAFKTIPQGGGLRPIFCIIVQAPECTLRFLIHGFWFLPGIVEFSCLGGPRGLRNHSKRWGAKHPTCLKGFPGPSCGSRGGGNPLGCGVRATSEVGGSRDGAPVTEAGGLGQRWGSCLLEHACWGSRTLGQV